MQSAKARIEAWRETEERNRLLYVALTRARDRLYVAGFEGAQAPPADCWYNLIKEGLAGRLRSVTRPPTAAPSGASQRADRPARGRQGPRLPPATGTAPLPAWANTPAPREPLLDASR